MATYTYRFAKLEAELQQVKDQMKAKDEKMEKQMKAKDEKIEKMEKELREMKVQQMDQITKVDHLEKINAARCYAATLPAPGPGLHEIVLKGQHKYTPGTVDFIHHGGILHYARFSIRPDDEGKSIVGYPDDFFPDLIKYTYESVMLEEMIGYVVIELPKGKPAPWPKPLVQLHGADFGWVSEEQLKADGVPATLKELQKGDQSIEMQYVGRNVVHYTLRNKHKPEMVIRLRIWFEDGASMYKQMKTLVIERK